MIPPTIPPEFIQVAFHIIVEDDPRPIPANLVLTREDFTTPPGRDFFVKITAFMNHMTEYMFKHHTDKKFHIVLVEPKESP